MQRSLKTLFAIKRPLLLMVIFVVALCCLSGCSKTLQPVKNRFVSSSTNAPVKPETVKESFKQLPVMSSPYRSQEVSHNNSAVLAGQCLGDLRLIASTFFTLVDEIEKIEADNLKEYELDLDLYNEYLADIETANDLADKDNPATE